MWRPLCLVWGCPCWNMAGGRWTKACCRRRPARWDSRRPWLSEAAARTLGNAPRCAFCAEVVLGKELERKRTGTRAKTFTATQLRTCTLHSRPSRVWKVIYREKWNVGSRQHQVLENSNSWHVSCSADQQHFWAPNYIQKPHLTKFPFL